MSAPTLGRLVFRHPVAEALEKIGTLAPIDERRRQSTLSADEYRDVAIRAFHGNRDRLAPGLHAPRDGGDQMSRPRIASRYPAPDDDESFFREPERVIDPGPKSELLLPRDHARAISSRMAKCRDRRRSRV